MVGLVLIISLLFSGECLTEGLDGDWPTMASSVGLTTVSLTPKRVGVSPTFEQARDAIGLSLES